MESVRLLFHWDRRHSGIDQGNLKRKGNQETNYAWPRPKWSDDDQTRLVSDLKVDPNTGKVYASACFDGGNNGPFAGVLYSIGTLSSSKIRICA